MKYKVIETDGRESLTAQVNKALEYNWRPIGGIAFVQTSGDGWYYAQALISDGLDIRIKGANKEHDAS